MNLPGAGRPRRSRVWTSLAISALGAALLANLVFAARTLGREGFAGWSVSPGFLVLGACLALVPWFTLATRTWIWARFLGCGLSAGEAIRISVAADLGNALAPTLAGGNAVRILLLVERGLGPGRASALVGLQLLEDAVFFGVALPVAYLGARNLAGPQVEEALARAGARALLVLAVGVAIGGLATILWRYVRARRGTPPESAPSPLGSRVRTWAREAGGTLSEVARRGKRRAAATLALTAVQWCCRYLVVAAVLAAFGVEVPVPVHIVLQWVVFTAGTCVPTPGGAAAVEAAFAAVYAPLVPGSLLGGVMALWRLEIFYLVLALDLAVLGGFLVGGRWRGLGRIVRAGRGQRSPTRFQRIPASSVPENSVSSTPGT